MHTDISARGELLITLWLASERLSARADHSLGAVHGIACVEFMVLYQLALAPAQGIRRIDLARAVGRSASGVTRLLRPMEKIGLVRRGHSERDARVSLVALTDAGRLKLDESLATVDRMAQQSTRALSGADIRRAATSLEALTE